jgi:hypothetical protein
MVDLSRLGVYIKQFVDLEKNIVLVIAATAAAFAGAYVGNTYIKHITLKTVQIIVMIMIFILSIALGLGVL